MMLQHYTINNGTIKFVAGSFISWGFVSTIWKFGPRTAPLTFSF